MCTLGNRLLKNVTAEQCNRDYLRNVYCNNSRECDTYFNENDVTIVNGIKGLASGVFLGILIKFF